jgi:hypothetical protein
MRENDGMDDAKRTERVVTDVDADVLDAVRDIARRQGRDVGAVVDEALTDLVHKVEPPSQVRPDVMDIYQTSKVKFDKLYKKLAE